MEQSWYRKKAAECARNALVADTNERKQEFEEERTNWLNLAERHEAMQANLVSKSK
jgi:phage terminase Nu1 subunit (DNA packaging protein)